ncbi:hypothetical protein M885DRAFT_460259, partial [Pelagophyceae sp. CCMP2097]
MLRLRRRAAPALGVREFVAFAGEAELYVSNIPKTFTEDSVRKVFSEVCAVRRVHLPINRRTGYARGNAFVVVDETAADEVCAKLDRSEVFGERIRVEKERDPLHRWLANRPRPPRPNPLRLPDPPPRPAVDAPPFDANAAAEVFEKDVDTLNNMLDEASATEILLLFHEESDVFTGVNLATALHRLGKLSRTFDTKKHRPVLKSLLRHATASVVDEPKLWGSKALANAVWGASKLGGDPRMLFEAVSVEALKKIGTYNAHELVNTVWAYATVKAMDWKHSKAVMHAVAFNAPNKLPCFHPQSVSNMSWAFATAGVPAPDLFEGMALKAVMRIDDFKAQEFANTAWAFAKLGAPAPMLFDAMAKAAREKIAEFQPQNLTNTAWAFATAGVAAPDLFAAMA